MKITLTQKIKAHKGAFLAALTEEDSKKISAKYPKKVKEFITDRVKNDKYSAKKSSSLQTYINDKELPEQLLVFGLGEKDELNANKMRELGGELAKKIAGLKKSEATLLISKTLEKYFYEFIEGLLLSQYKNTLYKTKKDEEKFSGLEKLNLISDKKELKNEIKKAEAIVASVDYIKNLVNSPANIIDSDYLEKEVKKIAKDNSYKKTIYNQAKLEKMKAGGILAVNQGCDREAKLMVLEYQGAKSKKEKPIVLIGKGVIFDTGGYNLKRTGHIEEMHQDMAGAATVLGVMKAVKDLNIKKNIIAVIPVVENLINQDAYRPSDIITMLSGNTVEITNTDAEGRLILADAIHYGTQQDPELMVTIATLTGAAFVALGHRYSALAGNDPEHISALKESAEKVDDLAWDLPIHNDYRKEMDSKIADFRNYDKGSGGGAGTTKAAAFLEKFIDDKKWCHIDIGGTAFTAKPKKYEQRGATAHGLRMLINFLER